MQVRPRRHPVQRRHVLAMLALLTLSTWAITAPIYATEEHGLVNLAAPLIVSVPVVTMFFLPTLRHTCTHRGSWIALRRAQRNLRDFGLCVSLLFMILLIATVSHSGSLSADRGSVVLGMCFDGIADGVTLYCWALAALPALRGVVWIDGALQNRGVR